jgi:hypothetical protein
MTNSPEDYSALSEAAYRQIDLDRLVMVAVSQLRDAGLELSYENAVVAAFRLFPAKFGLIGYPTYPDAKRVHDALWHCSYKSKRWLSGKTRLGFAITEVGEATIADAKRLLSGDRRARQPAFSQTRRKETILAEVLASDAYAKFVVDAIDDISEAELCYVLQGTLDSPKNLLVSNLNGLRRMAVELDKASVTQFLEVMSKRFSGLLGLKAGKGGR